MARDSINTMLMRGPIHIRQPLDHVLQKLHTLRATLESAKRDILEIKSAFEIDLRDDILHYSQLEEEFSNQKLLAEACSGLSTHLLDVKNHANLLRFRLLAMETTVVNRARRDEFEYIKEERVEIPMPKHVDPIEKPVSSTTLRRGPSNASAGWEIKPLSIKKKTETTSIDSSVIMTKPKSQSADASIIMRPKPKPKTKTKPKSVDAPVVIKPKYTDAHMVMKEKGVNTPKPSARTATDKKKRIIKRRSHRLTRILFDPIG